MCNSLWRRIYFFFERFTDLICKCLRIVAMRPSTLQKSCTDEWFHLSHFPSKAEPAYNIDRSKTAIPAVIAIISLVHDCEMVVQFIEMFRMFISHGFHLSPLVSTNEERHGKASLLQAFH
ncbi:hypothetical protein RB195_011900 [Necator americanus]|uniref:Uncharacterized protein n=1 Tax=Necator americanus TaxID=51031 RepID=A0ABR1D7Q9_NECAM